MQRVARIAIAAGILAISGGGPWAQATAPWHKGWAINAPTPPSEVLYGIQMQGTQPVPPPQGGGTQTLIGVVVRTYRGGWHVQPGR